MRLRGSFPVVLLVVTVVAAGTSPAVLATTVAAQGGMGGGQNGGGTGGQNGGGMGGQNGGGMGGPNVSVGPGPRGGQSVTIRNVGENRTIRVQFRYGSNVPDMGVRMHEMTVTTARGGDYQFTVRTAANASAGVPRFAGPAPFGYFNVTHTFPNANVTNASMTFALDRTRLRQRNVSAENVSLYRYTARNRTWDRLRTHVVERNASQVTFRAESPGLSEFAVAPTTAASTPTATPTETATTTATTTGTATATSPPSTETPTQGGGPGFGPVPAVVALLAAAALARWG
ncbi:MAG: PGF-pre-PGF domain-containing protein [Haloferacaceae archaeon]